MQLSLERIMNSRRAILTSITTMVIGMIRKQRLFRRSEFPAHSKYGATSKVYEILMKRSTPWKLVWTPLDPTSADRTYFPSSVLADRRSTNHPKHCPCSIVTTANKWKIPTMQSPIEMSPQKYSHYCHLSI